MKTYFTHQQRLWEARPDLRRHTLEMINQQNLKSGRPTNPNFGGIDSRTISDIPIQRNEIHLTSTSQVELADREAVLVGIQKIIQEVQSKLTIKNWGAFNVGYGPYNSSDWYQSRAGIKNRNLGFGTQLNVYEIDKLLRDEPAQKGNPHYDVFLADRDLTASARHPDNRFVYGMSMYPNTVISTARMKGDNNWKLVVLAMLSAHEMGHNFGLVDRNFNVGKGNMKAKHCNEENGPCLMAQVDVPGCRTITEQTRLLIERNFWLCDDCLGEAEYKKQNLEKNQVLW